MTTAALSPFGTPGEALRHQAKVRPDAEALAFPLSGGRLSFAGWLEEATALARGLLALGLAPGQHVALLAQNRREWPVVQLGLALAGLVMVPLNSHLRQDDLTYGLDQSDSVALLLSRRFRSSDYLAMVAGQRDRVPRLNHVICFDGADTPALDYKDILASGRSADSVLPEIAAGDIAALLYTSGTTGFPKGALLTHAGMLANAWGAAQRLGAGPGDRWTSIIPLFHCAGCVLNLLGSLQSGAAYVGVPAFDPVSMLEIIESERCTMLSGVPTSYIAMLDHPERRHYDLRSLRSGTCGGADVDPGALLRCATEFPMPRLAQVYGQTESSTLIACPELDDDDRFATAGRPLPGYEVRIADPQTGTILPPGTIGQIQARGMMVMRGYYKKPDETAEILDAEGWLSTGDLGYLRGDGRLVIAGGRLRDMIIRGGENIYPAEIENLMRAHPSVAEVAVFGLPDAYYGEVVAAALRLTQTIDATALAEFCKGRIARFKIPTRFFQLAAFPLTASGKIRKTELRELGSQGKLEPLS
jgi:acyl-CoA synthetase (AMP-forming)/AMP-acid ligase II